jgi:hypothetical protein
MTYSMNIGSRSQVWHGTAKKTSGGLTRKNLMMNKHGRIVSKAKHGSAKREMRLVKYGYTAKKGKFGYVKVGSKKSRKGSMKGGSGMNSLSPSSVNGSYMIKDVVPQQFSPLDYALTGGKRHKRSMKGGVAYGSAFAPGDVNSADITGVASGNGIDGQGITNYGSAGSAALQLQAGQAGGKRRRKSMRGGTTMPVPWQSPGNPNNMALSNS